MRLLVTRPEPDATALKAQLIGMGHEVLIEPLLKVVGVPIDEGEVELDEAQALIATSRNGLRALASSSLLARATGIPIFVVGPGTASTARAIGFTDVVEGPGDAHALVGTIAERAEVNAGPLVYLAGETKAADIGGELRRLGFHVQEPVVYSIVPAERFSAPITARLAAGEVDGVLLMSPRTALTYVGLVRRHKLEGAVAKVLHLCLSTAVAKSLRSLDNPRMAIAEMPNAKSLLALIAQCVP